jgi:alkanesulfonate monooxygenase SsuD/methylene tetrahydromethanopterin reductase-like flavin-dependent oxidoreductase (luciferase family)
MIRYGVCLPNGGVPARSLVEFGCRAEAAGWDGVFLEDYIVWQSDQAVPTFDPWAVLAATAVRTDRIRLGIQVTPLARRRPWKVAAEAVTVDHLSNGRMILGVGLGDTGEAVGADINFTHFGEELDPKRRAGQLDEALEIVVGLWSGQPFSYVGRFFNVKEITVLPRPVQSPRIPIWVGGGYPLRGPVNRAIRWDGSCLYRHKSQPMMPDDVRALRQLRAGHRPDGEAYDIAVGGRPRPGPEQWDLERRHIRSMAEAGITWWIEYLPPDDERVMRACVERGPLRID